MSEVYKAVCEKLLLKEGKSNDLCCLCLTVVDEHAISVNDEVMVFPENADEDLKLMGRILVEILGENITQCMSVFESVCKQCAQSAIDSYKFIKKSKETMENLICATDDLGNCFENVSEETDTYQTLYVSIVPKDKTMQQFYDGKKQTNPSETALARFHFIAYGSTKPVKGNDGYKKPRDYSTIFIKTHELVADPSKPKEYKCKMCLKMYPTSGNLRQHFFSAHFKKEFPCSECSKSFGTAGLLQTHMSISHCTVECSECGKVLLNRTSTLKRHAKIHSKSRKICYRCGRMYKKVTDFNKHMAQDTCQMPSRIPGDYTCDTCGYHCNYKHQLLNHIKYEHTDAEGHVCQWCNRKCYSASALKTHILKHTKEKNYVCSVCGGKFVTKQSLINHTRLHTGERPYPCNQCDQSFLSASRRNDHIERYHVSKTFDCDLCDAKYSARRSLVKHRKRHFTMDHEY
ncbi:gastrula zinc finger protein XlCGF57.1-like [Pectinophora gossypiella]|uniref:C2H2-type domain-containing protein n=1 Tax=Pectinophora gossypiella TaxID=13191 RepID=A0A1E1WS62_PECGO|nr:gastrula zinc finger protein XlCGF57.1-like [Pectinophora gossypiella]